MAEKYSLKKGAVISFGVFDGVHIGHQSLVQRMLDQADKLGIETVIITFDPHPALSTSGKAPPIITTLSKKIELLKSRGIDRIIIEDFNDEFSRLSPKEFVRDILIGRFHAQEIIVGYDCAFGKDRAGDKELLKELGKKYDVKVEVIEPYNYDGAIVSSTRVRNAIINGELDLANTLLGRPYSIFGKVVCGKGIGHKIGYATANLDTQNEVLPPSGVYAIGANVDEKSYGGVLNMGTQPTFGDGQFRIEAHFFDYGGGELYGHEIEVFFLKSIREERVFSSPNELADQIKKDEMIARKILGSKI